MTEMAVTNTAPFVPVVLPMLNDAESPDRDTALFDTIAVPEYFKVPELFMVKVIVAFLRVCPLAALIVKPPYPF